MRERVGIDVGGDAQQMQREGAIRICQVVVPHLPREFAVHAALQALRVGRADIAGNEMERHPDPALVAFVAVGEVDGMMGRGFRVDA